MMRKEGENCTSVMGMAGDIAVLVAIILLIRSVINNLSARKN